MINKRSSPIFHVESNGASGGGRNCVAATYNGHHWQWYYRGWFDASRNHVVIQDR